MPDNLYRVSRGTRRDAACRPSALGACRLGGRRWEENFALCARSSLWLWGTLLSAAFAYLAFLSPTEVLLPYIVKNDLHASAADLGLIFAAGGVGAVGAALVMGQRGDPSRDVAVMYAGLDTCQPRRRWVCAGDGHVAADDRLPSLQCP